MMWTTILLFSVFIAVTAYFCWWDIKYRMIPNKVMYICMAIPVPFIVLEWIFNYIPNMGVFPCVFWGVIGVIIPFVWYFFMRKYIGEQDVKWLVLLFLAFPFKIILLVALLIIAILITFGIFKKTKTEMLPAMVSIEIAIVVNFVLSFFI